MMMVPGDDSRGGMKGGQGYSGGGDRFSLLSKGEERSRRGVTRRKDDGRCYIPVISVATKAS